MFFKNNLKVSFFILTFKLKRQVVLISKEVNIKNILINNSN